MSARNLQSEPSLPKRLGEIVTLPYVGDIFTAADGTVWKASNALPLAYSANYARLLTDAAPLVLSSGLMNGPFANNSWANYFQGAIVGGTGVGATWLVAQGLVNSSVDFFYTSTDAGVTWTQRTPPAAGKAWAILWDGTNFVAYPQSTANAYESTDGITWTTRTAINVGQTRDIYFNGTVYFATSISGTVVATSPDRTTWTSRTVTSQSNSTTLGNMGQATWNAGAGLWMMGTSTAGTYQTSPDAATWTARTTMNASDAMFVNSLKWASNTTTTVAVGGLGTVAVTTDGINWGYNQYEPNTDAVVGTVTGIYWDGTRFVIVMGWASYYSTNGTSWTKNTFATLPSVIKTPVGAMQRSGAWKRLHLTDPTSVTPAYIVSTSASADAVARSYMRIL